MPRRNEPKTLRESAMVKIALYFDRLCYNCKSKEEMRKILENESFLDIAGPFQYMRKYLFVLDWRTNRLLGLSIDSMIFLFSFSILCFILFTISQLSFGTPSNTCFVLLFLRRLVGVTKSPNNMSCIIDTHKNVLINKTIV